ncbi:carboxymuconolactone decarboxylase family protein, partial [Acidithiobacillus thiooxidans]|uniref:hypothetical protein n=1 Tax=Acidithiobacillus thiooxidans TaxID=930 RepID=UPI001C07EDB4
MTTLTLTPLSEATGELAELYAAIEKSFGGVPEGLQLFGVSPKLLAIQMQLLGYFGQHPRLSGNFLALLRYILSEDGHCQFCIGFNQSLLVNAGIQPEAIQKAVENPRNGPLAERENLLLDYVVRAVRNPHGVKGVFVICCVWPQIFREMSTFQSRNNLCMGERVSNVQNRK